MELWVTELTDSLSQSEAHGQANTPIIICMMRGYDSGTSAYSRWHLVPFSTRTGSGGLSYYGQFNVHMDTTNIYFDAQVAIYWVDTQDDSYRLSSTYKTWCYLYNSSGALTNIWDTWQFKYFVFAEGV